MAESTAGHHPVAFGRGPGAGEPLGNEQKLMLWLIVSTGAVHGITSIVTPDPERDRTAPLVLYFVFVSALVLLGEPVRGNAATLRRLAVIEALVYWIVAVHASVLVAVGPTEPMLFAVVPFAAGLAVLRTFPIGDRWVSRIWAVVLAVWLTVLAWLVVGWTLGWT